MNIHDAELINADRQRQAKMLREHLESMGVQVRIVHYTGDSSYPTEYTLTHGTLSAVGPTLDLALLEFVNRLLTTDKADAYRAMETALQVLAGNINSLRTELLFVKAEIMKEQEP